LKIGFRIWQSYGKKIKWHFFSGHGVIVTSTDMTIAQNVRSDNSTELMSDKCSERRLSTIIPRSLSATAVCNVGLSTVPAQA